MESAKIAELKNNLSRSLDYMKAGTAADLVRRHAERLVESHPLGAADALQLGAALAAGEDDPAALDFVTFDRQQALAAEREGFRALGS